MNFLRRAIAVQPLLSAHSSRKRLLVLYPVSLLHHSSLYSTYRTATTYATTKLKCTPTRSKTKPPEQPSSRSPVSDSDVVIEKKPVDLARPSEIPCQRSRTATTYATTKYKYTPPPEQPPSPSPVIDSDVVIEKKPVDLARPSEIPYQPKVANLVKLIGRVLIPVQFKATEDGNYWAGTIIAQQQSSKPSSPPSVWIPVVFEGDLAHIANDHLKEKDFVYIEGELCADQPQLALSQGQANVQVMAHSLNFVEVVSQSIESSVSQTTDLSSIQGQKLKAPHSSEPISLDHKETFENVRQKKTSHPDMMKKKDNSSVGSWRDLLKDPKQWFDYRESKRNGSVKPKHPDFRHKDSGVGLWLDSAPGGVLAGLKALDFDVNQVKDKRDDDVWNDLVENFEKWQDNRSKKVSERSPDFKHKETGKALWLSNSPPWVSSRLPPLEAEQNVAGDQDGDPWKDLVENYNKWWDNRSNKLNAKAPDFIHKDTKKALWLSDAPAWALAKLPHVNVKGTDVGAYQKKQKESDAGDVEGGPWKDLVDNQKKWWDNRSNKVNERAPDFKHKETGQALWLNSAPQWALSRLPPLEAKQTWGAETM